MAVQLVQSQRTAVSFANQLRSVQMICMETCVLCSSHVGCCGGDVVVVVEGGGDDSMLGVGSTRMTSELVIHLLRCSTLLVHTPCRNITNPNPKTGHPEPRTSSGAALCNRIKQAGPARRPCGMWDCTRVVPCKAPAIDVICSKDQELTQPTLLHKETQCSIHSTEQSHRMVPF